MSGSKWALSGIAWAALVALACCGDPADRIVIGGSPEGDAAPPSPPRPDAPPTITEDDPPDSSFPAPEVLRCVATECVAPFETCPSSRWACQTNLDSDMANCGSCGNKCPQNPNAGEALKMTFSCVEGSCRAECKVTIDLGVITRTANCNGILEDGCEVGLGSKQNCSQCGDACAGELSCVNFQCGCQPGFVRTGDQCECPQGAIECNGRCVDPNMTDSACGTCGTQCPWAPGPDANTHIGCVGATCGQAKCNDDYLDCDEDPSNGCEVWVKSDSQNCNGCGNVCGAGKQCFRGECVCDNGTFCGTSCNDLAIDAANCGQCNNVCPGQTAQDAAFWSLPPPNGAPACTGGTCDYACEAGWADCDEDITNGCETDIQTNPLRCGSCNNQCDLRAGQVCSRGECAMRTCEPGEVR